LGDYLTGPGDGLGESFEKKLWTLPVGAGTGMQNEANGGGRGLSFIRDNKQPSLKKKERKAALIRKRRIHRRKESCHNVRPLGCTEGKGNWSG